MQAWQPDAVLILPDSDTMYSPEALHATGLRGRPLLRLLAVRNLSRNVILACCSVEWQPAEK